MADPDNDTLDKIIFFCTRGRFESLKKVDPLSFQEEFAQLQTQGYTGAINLTSEGPGGTGSDWIVLDKGQLKLVISEPEKVTTDLTPKEGYIRVFALSEAQMTEVRGLLDLLKVPKPRIISAEQAAPPPAREAPKKVEAPPAREAPKRAEPPPAAREVPKKVEAEPAPPRREAPPQAEAAPEVQKEPEVLDRKEVMKKYRLKEPSEAYVESLLKGFREPTEEDMIRCKSMLEQLKKKLQEMFGESMADRMYEKQFKELHIEKEYMTAKDVGDLLESFEHNILQKFVGPESAQQTIKKLKKEILPSNLR
jgi:hypothetical protein